MSHVPARDAGSAKNFAIAIVGNLFGPAVSVITAPILAHALGVVGRGEVAAATAPLGLIVVAATFGVPEATTYAIARAPRTAHWVVRRGASLISTIGILATIGVVFLAPLLSGGDEAIQKNILIASIAIMPSLLVGILRGAAMGLHQWKLVAFSRAVDSGFRLVAIIVLALAGSLNVLAATIILAVSPVIGGLALLFLFKRIPAQRDATTHVGTTKGLLQFGLPVWFGAISGILLLRLDQVLLVPLSNSFELGLYAVAVAVSEVPLIVNSGVRDVVFSSDAADANSERLGIASRLSTLATASIALVLALTIKLWLGPVFGEEFAPALGVSLILLAATVLGNPGSVAGAGLSARGRPGLRSLSLLIAAVLNTALLASLVPAMGAVGAGIATLVGNITASNLNIYFLYRHFGIKPIEFYAFRLSDIRLLLGIPAQIYQRFIAK